MKNFKLLGALICTSPLLCHYAQAGEGESRPNILFCIADDALFHHFSANGCSWTNTPSFDRVAKEGVIFERCYTPNAKSGPSRSIILTGLQTWQLEEAGNHNAFFPEDIDVITDALSSVGYNVAFTGKGWGPGDPGVRDGADRQLTGVPFQKRKCTPLTKKSNTNDYAANFNDFLDSVDGDQPWFFWYGCTDPHRPYEYGSGIAKGGKDINSIDEVPPFWEDNVITRTDMLDYAYELENFDRHIGLMIDNLKERNELDNTIIIVTSDNGMPFPRCKANSYEYSTHMPLAIMWPDGLVNPGRTSDHFVSFVDLAPTFADLAGIEDETKVGLRPFTGSSICSIIKDDISTKESRQRESILLGRERHDYGRPNNQGYPIRAIIKDSMLLIANIKPDLFPAGNPETGYLDADGGATKSDMLANMRKGECLETFYLSFGLRPLFELYNLNQDRYCIDNLYNKERYSKIAKRMYNAMVKELKRQNDPRFTGDEVLFDNYLCAIDKAKTFYEDVVSGKITEPWNITKWVTPTDYDNHPDNK